VAGISVNTYLATTDNQQVCPEAHERICQQRFGFNPDPAKSPGPLQSLQVTEVSTVTANYFTPENGEM